MKYTDLIDGLKKTIDLRCGVGTAQKSTYRLIIDSEQVELVNGMIPIDAFSGRQVGFSIEDADFTNKLKAGGVVVSGGKTGKDVDSVQKGCCKSCKCCGV